MVAARRIQKGFEMGAKDWFARWFGAEYKRLYPHRDGAQAAAQVAALLRAIEALPRTPGSVPAIDGILDIGCGAGRHLAAFQAVSRQGAALHFRDLHVTGIDLSAVLLRDARAGGLDVARADMRRLPFTDGSFTLVACFFTSFGYFATPDEDAAALREFARVLRPGGLLFLDLPNREHILKNLVASDVSESEGRRVIITRDLEGDCVVKRIHISGMDADGEEHVYEERVRLWTRDSLGPVLVGAGLEAAAVLGDEHGAPFDPESSPRMSLLLQAVPAVGARA